MNKYKHKYEEGLEMGQFKRINEISHYNYNYYVGFDFDLLFGKSDDDDTTDWYVVSNRQFVYLGQSYVSDCDKLHHYNSVPA